MLPNVRKVQSVEREETSVCAVEFFQLVIQFKVVFFLVARVKVSLENRSLWLVAESLDKPCIVQFVEDFLCHLL